VDPLAFTQYPAANSGPLAGRLTRCGEDHDGRRIPRADARKQSWSFTAAVYLLGIIARHHYRNKEKMS
jgi:hypothetical protein